MDTIEAGSNVSSMVDDIFFIVRKCIRRSASSGNLDGVCAVINNACAALETEVCPALKQQLKLGYPSGYLDLTQAYNVVLQGRLQPSDSEQARHTFLVSHFVTLRVICCKLCMNLLRVLQAEFIFLFVQRGQVTNEYGAGAVVLDQKRKTQGKYLNDSKLIFCSLS